MLANMTTILAHLIFPIAGSIIALGAAALALREFRFLRRAAQAAAIIRNRHVKSGLDSDGGSLTTLTVTVEFEDQSGAQQQATVPVVAGSSLAWRSRNGREVRLFGPPDYAVGDSVAILYDPEQPEQIQVNTWMNRWLWTVVMGVMVITFLCAGLML
jgi:hypothetical protein